jgi:uncharacterized protein YndB with AHSA1/START domain
MNPTVCEDTIVQEVTINAPAERIFAALTRPEELLRWWAWEGRFRITHAECDLRPGGRWMMRVAGLCAAEGSVTTVRGEYRAIEAPKLLIFTWIREEENHPETLVRWDLEEKDGATTVRVTHSGLTSEWLRTRNGGWSMIATVLKAYAEKQDEA